MLFGQVIADNLHKVILRNLSHKTIYALSSGFGKCGVAVIRVSGPNTKEALLNICKSETLPKPRYATLKKLYHPVTSDMIDKGLIIWFPGPQSFTGEDACEFQIHGGPAVIASMLDALNSIKGCIMAKPGDFTKRAFYEGKLDLTEVEGIADLVHSETELQRKQAILQANGSLSILYKSWRAILLKNIAHLEAYIDFSEDENIEDDIFENLNNNLINLRNEIVNHLNDGRRGERLRIGVRSTIIGAPNVGKSSFINLICQKPISIVTNIEGTTRDIIETHFNIGGYPILLADTAGLRKRTEDIVEIEGITRAKSHAKQADFIILIIDSLHFINSKHNHTLDNYKSNYLNELGLDENDFKKTKQMIVFNKIDLVSDEQSILLRRNTNIDAVFLSCKESIGLDEVTNKIKDTLKVLCGSPNSENPVISHARHRQLLNNCLINLEDYLSSISKDKRILDYSILAHQLRIALRCLGEITGEVSTEEILDVIFKDFCIGK